ncbi:hypothetical protein D3C75_626120 [compost metagenome]
MCESASVTVPGIDKAGIALLLPALPSVAHHRIVGRFSAAKQHSALLHRKGYIALQEKRTCDKNPLRHHYHAASRASIDGRLDGRGIDGLPIRHRTEAGNIEPLPLGLGRYPDRSAWLGHGSAPGDGAHICLILPAAVQFLRRIIGAGNNAVKPAVKINAVAGHLRRGGGFIPNESDAGSRLCGGRGQQVAGSKLLQ